MRLLYPPQNAFNSILMRAGSQIRRDCFDFTDSTIAKFVIDQPLAVIARRMSKLVLSA